MAALARVPAQALGVPLLDGGGVGQEALQGGVPLRDARAGEEGEGEGACVVVMMIDGVMSAKTNEE